MSGDNALRLAYAANIVILLPVVATLLRATAPAIFGAATAESPPLRLLVAALWGAILVCSAIGLAAPRMMLGILVLQIVYKTGWLVTFVLPAFRRGDPVPWGPALTFMPIVLVWPAILIEVLT